MALLEWGYSIGLFYIFLGRELYPDGDKKEKSVEESFGNLKDSLGACEVSREKREKRASYLGKTLAIFLEKALFWEFLSGLQKEDYVRLVVGNEGTLHLHGGPAGGVLEPKAESG